MKRGLIALVMTAALLWAAPAAFAADEALQVVTYSVDEINAITVSYNPIQLHVAAAEPGQQPRVAEDTSSTYSITTNGVGKKITARLDRPLEDGVTLSIKLEAPEGAVSRGFIDLTTSSQDVVDVISRVAASDLQIAYRLAASVDAGRIEPTDVTVILTLTSH